MLALGDPTAQTKLSCQIAYWTSSFGKILLLAAWIVVHCGEAELRDCLRVNQIFHSDAIAFMAFRSSTKCSGL